MKVAVLKSPYRIDIEEKSIPNLEPGWVLVDVFSAGICGSDLHFYYGKIPITQEEIRGHEIVGQVKDPGDSNFQIGDEVIVSPLIGCDSCQACTRGEKHLCEKLTAIGGPYPGGFAEFVAVPEEQLYKFDSSKLQYDHAVLADCVAVALHAINKINFKKGETVVIIGDGAIGLLLVQMSHIYGAKKIYLAGKHKHNLDLGLQFGADKVIQTPLDLKTAKEQIDFVEPDVVFEAAGGSNPSLGIGVSILRKGGRLGLLGFIDIENVEVSWLDVVMGEKEIVGIMGYSTWNGRDEMRDTISLMEKHKFDLETLITDRISLENINDGFKALMDKKKSKSIKVIIQKNFK